MLTASGSHRACLHLQQNSATHQGFETHQRSLLGLAGWLKPFLGLQPLTACRNHRWDASVCLLRSHHHHPSSFKMVQGWVSILQDLVLRLRHSRPVNQEGTSREENQKMGQVVYLGLCLLGCLILNPLAEGAANRTQSARAHCPPGAVFYRKYCYEYFSSSLSWDDAEVSCQKRHGSQLASILSAREANVVYSYLRNYGSSNVWIGLVAARGSSNMIWEWSDGSDFSQPLWDGRSISTSISSYECVSVSYSGSQKWIQRSCTTTLPFLCKYKATY